MGKTNDGIRIWNRIAPIRMRETKLNSRNVLFDQLFDVDVDKLIW
jgi:hypothetical protein